jgi:hypothetical protein
LSLCWALPVLFSMKKVQIPTRILTLTNIRITNLPRPIAKKNLVRRIQSIIFTILFAEMYYMILLLLHLYVLGITLQILSSIIWFNQLICLYYTAISDAQYCCILKYFYLLFVINFIFIISADLSSQVPICLYYWVPISLQPWDRMIIDF